MENKMYAEVQALSWTKDTPKGKLKGKVQEEVLCQACGWCCSTKMHLPLQGSSRAVAMPELEIPVPWPHTVLSWRMLRACGRGAMHQLPAKTRSGGTKGGWLTVTKELHGQSWSAGAFLLLLTTENLGNLFRPFNKKGEAVGNGLQSDEEEARCKQWK